MTRLVSWGEIRLGLRLIAKQPILSGTIILALATGIGLATMGFTLRDAIVHGTLPYDGGERFARFNVFDRDGGRIDLDLERYHLFVERAASFEHIGMVGPRPFTIAHGPGNVETVNGAFITPRSMRLVPGSPIAGRTLIPADGLPGAERVVLVRESLWTRRYGADPALIGRPLDIGGQSRTVEILTAELGRIDSPQMRDKVVAAAAALPGVIAAGAAQQLPRLYPPPRATAVEAVGDEPARAAQLAPNHAVGVGFLEAIGATALAGRLFTASDFIAGAAPVAVVNEPFVQKFLGGRNPIGRRIRVEGALATGAEEPWREIIGVVPDLGLSVGDPALSGGFYTPVRDEMLYFLAVRTTADPKTLVAPLRAAVAAVDPDLQLESILPLEEAGMAERAFLAGIASGLTAMGGMALLLSIVGIYALLSFMVTRRTREIGIRVALGATSRHVLSSITGGALVYLAIGGLIGSALGITFVQMRSMILISIPEPGFWMPLTIFLTLAVAGATACWLPARRALRIRPAEALNSD